MYHWLLFVLSEQRKVCQACYLVIESYLKGDSRKNENYLARFIDFFQKQVQSVGRTMRCMFKSVCLCVSR